MVQNNKWPPVTSGQRPFLPHWLPPPFFLLSDRRSTPLPTVPSPAPTLVLLWPPSDLPSAPGFECAGLRNSLSTFFPARHPLYEALGDVVFDLLSFRFPLSFVRPPGLELHEDLSPGSRALTHGPGPCCLSIYLPSACPFSEPRFYSFTTFPRMLKSLKADFTKKKSR